MIGHWTQEEMAASLKDITALANSGDDDVAEAFATAQEWIENALKKPDQILIGFHG